MKDRTKIFVAVSLADAAICGALAAGGLGPAVWLVNLPATITAGRLAHLMGGESMALAATIPAGAAFYGWAAGRLYGRPRRAPAHAGH
ncbi:MAG TPA: hypothetical protein VJV23_09895 [Candidatus Polarisedimenticolia bacterium]|nr:hypothetical protein [Candidatus Polarisedimenticolia bacterium]